MPLPAVLLAFIDDEMLRAPMTLDLVTDAVLEQWRLSRGGLGAGRGEVDPSRVLKSHRGELVAAALRALRHAVDGELKPRTVAVPGSDVAAGRPLPQHLALIDEDDVVADIAQSRCIEAVKLRAEESLRELQTYTAALVGDLHVSRDTNPFRPEVFVRALWQGVLALPLSRAAQAAYLNDAAVPLAQGLTLAYAAAISRLDEQGVVPAAHRTIVTVGGGFGTRTTPRYHPPADLQVVRNRLPGAVDHLTHTAAVAPTPPRQAETPPPPDAEPQLVRLLTRLFDEIHADRSLPPELCALLRRLQPAALRVAMADPSLLDSYDHPVWRFMDTLAHGATLGSSSDRMRVLGLARNLVDHLAANDGIDTADGSRFVWAMGRVTAMTRHALAQALQAAAPAIERRRREAAATSEQTTVPLDIATLDTVPAALMPDSGPDPVLGEVRLHPGEHLHAYLQGGWRMLQLLERDDALGFWVLRAHDDDRLWAVRPAAVERLVAERLAKPVRMRSLVRRAAERVMRAG